jgi:glycosyltransferase involved in cell wall biosynthesis
VDHGSPDNCGAICDEYASKDVRVRVIHKPNGGLSDARNAGLKIAQGEYIAFVDSDDWVTPAYLQQLFDGINQTQADICECDIIHTDSECVVPIPAVPYETRVFSTTEALKQLIQDGVFHQYVWNKLYKRHVLEGILFEKGKTNEDEFWTYQVFGNAASVARISCPLYYYFQRPTSIMGTGYSIKRLDALEAKSQRQAYMKQHFPELTSLAKLNLIGSAIYSAQMSLLHLRGTDFEKAKEIIDNVVSSYPLTKEDWMNTDNRSVFWLKSAQLSFWGTCRIKNLLKRGL